MNLKKLDLTTSVETFPRQKDIVALYLDIEQKMGDKTSCAFIDTESICIVFQRINKCYDFLLAQKKPDRWQKNFLTLSKEGFSPNSLVTGILLSKIRSVLNTENSKQQELPDFKKVTGFLGTAYQLYQEGTAIKSNTGTISLKISPHDGSLQGLEMQQTSSGESPSAKKTYVAFWNNSEFVLIDIETGLPLSTDDFNKMEQIVSYVKTKEGQLKDFVIFLQKIVFDTLPPHLKKNIEEDWCIRLRFVPFDAAASRVKSLLVVKDGKNWKLTLEDKENQETVALNLCQDHQYQNPLNNAVLTEALVDIKELFTQPLKVEIIDCFPPSTIAEAFPTTSPEDWEKIPSPPVVLTCITKFVKPQPNTSGGKGKNAVLYQRNDENVPVLFIDDTARAKQLVIACLDKKGTFRFLALHTRKGKPPLVTGNLTLRNLLNLVIPRLQKNKNVCFLSIGPNERLDEILSVQSQ